MSNITRKASGDRFIPARSQMNIDVANYKLMSKENAPNNLFLKSPSKTSYRSSLASSILSHSGTTGLSQAKVLACKNKAPAPAETYQNHLRILYSQNNTQGAGIKKSHRVIRQQPVRVLDAPNLVDDYYLNLLDWGSNNMLAVALGSVVYLWHAASGEITEIDRGEDFENDNITSVQFIEQGNTLALGTDSAEVQLWDVNRCVQVRSMKGHSDRVGALSWNKHILSSGSKDSTIVHHDVRIQDHVVDTLTGHKQEVCGLKWSPDGTQLASGSNDNMLMLWGEPNTDSTPQFVLNHHTAAVKALDWCPFQSNLLASGGGSSDRCIKLWNTKTGSCINSIDTKTQVCSLKWSKTYRELISSHGYSQNQLTVWKYPSMEKMTELTGHSERVLHTAISPDGTTVASAGADERLRFWNVWPKKTARAKRTTRVAAGASRNRRAINIR
eukprot:TRINITY_DN21783_c0_g1_i1.p1 TRINITY_DN21783_c0_g1~~TRINITY_DN21783_c0_g1_i1.p1  ORF type:complete len:442 (+),score=67.71 TRINITY_DN21783_c0_g1_i1:81-1406(+)